MWFVIMVNIKKEKKEKMAIKKENMQRAHAQCTLQFIQTEVAINIFTHRQWEI